MATPLSIDQRSQSGTIYIESNKETKYRAEDIQCVCVVLFFHLMCGAFGGQTQGLQKQLEFCKVIIVEQCLISAML